MIGPFQRPVTESVLIQQPQLPLDTYAAVAMMPSQG